MNITIPHVRDFKFDPVKGCHCQTFWPQFTSFSGEELKERIENAIEKNWSPDKLDQYKEALRLIKIYTHESFLEACQILKDINYGLDFYQTNSESPCVILAFMPCCV